MLFRTCTRRVSYASLPLLLVTAAALGQQTSTAKPVQVAVMAKPAAAPRPGQAQDAQAMLKTTLAKLAVASGKFKSAEAHVQRVDHTRAINSDDTQTGMMYVMREGGAAQFGVAMQPPGPKVVEYKNGILRVDTPGACFNTIKQEGIDGYVTLGFGGTPKDLADNWTITDLGQETMSGTKVEKLSLVPRNPKVARSYTKVEIWVDLERDVTLKQIFHATDGDTSTATYTDIRYNEPVKEIRFNQPIKSGPYAIKDKACQ